MQDNNLNLTLASIKPFFDQKFPPSQSSFMGQYRYKESYKTTEQYSQIIDRYKQVQWKRVTEVIQNSKIFINKIQPNDIIQGNIGNCYFLAALAAIAEKPQRIHDLFVQTSIPKDKRFLVKMLFRGKKVTIQLDEWVPTRRGQLVGAVNNKKQLWVILLEKAWAKLYNNYLRTESGFPDEALHDLTGAPIGQMEFKYFSQQQIWDKIYSICEKQIPIVASSSDSKKFKQVLEFHAYTILSAVHIKTKTNQQHKAIKLRNPWARFQPQTSLSDYQPFWKNVSLEEKKRIGYNSDDNDGTFFIYFNNFLEQFAWIQYAEILENGKYIYCSAIDPKIKGVYFNLGIKKKGFYCLQIDKPSFRSYKLFGYDPQTGYSYPRANMIIKSNYTNEKWNFLENYADIQTKNYGRTFAIKRQFTPGNYTIKVLIDFDRKFEKDFEVTLGIYTVEQCYLRLATLQQAQILQEKKVNWSPQVSASLVQWSGGNNNYVQKMQQKQKNL